MVGNGPSGKALGSGLSGQELLRHLRLPGGRLGVVATDLASSALAALWGLKALGALRRRTVEAVAGFLGTVAPPAPLAPLPLAPQGLVRLELKELLVLHKPSLWQVDSETDRNSASVGSELSVGLR